MHIKNIIIRTEDIIMRKYNVENIMAANQTWMRMMKTSTIQEVISLNTVSWINDIPIVHCDELVRVLGMSLCLSMRMTVGDHKYVIVVDDNYMDCLSRESQMWFIYHELGHILVGDLDKVFDNPEKQYMEACYKRLSIIMEGKVMTEELHADAYACDMMGTNVGIDALSSMIEMFDNKSEPAVLEIKLRISTINNQQLLGVWAA